MTLAAMEKICGCSGSEDYRWTDSDWRGRHPLCLRSCSHLSVLQTCALEFAIKVTKQLRFLVNLLMKIKLYVHLGANEIEVKESNGRG